MRKVKVIVGETEHHIGLEELSDGSLKIVLDNEEHIVHVSEIRDEAAQNKSILNYFEHQKTIKAPMPGTVSHVFVNAGDEVKKNSTLLTLLAMKMENDITAQMDAKVKEVRVKCKDTVEADQVLIVLE